MNTIDIKGDDQTFREIVSRTIDSFVDDTLTSVGNYAFYDCRSLTSVDLPAVTSIGASAFENCAALTSVNIPVVTSVGNDSFSSCASLTSIELQSVTFFGSMSLSYCLSLRKLIIRNTSGVATLDAGNVFTNTNNVIIYVPDALVDSYKSASRWSNYASRIKGLSDLPT